MKLATKSVKVFRFFDALLGVPGDNFVDVFFLIGVTGDAGNGGGTVAGSLGNGCGTVAGSLGNGGARIGKGITTINASSELNQPACMNEHREMVTLSSTLLRGGRLYYVSLTPEHLFVSLERNRRDSYRLQTNMSH